MLVISENLAGRDNRKRFVKIGNDVSEDDILLIKYIQSCPCETVIHFVERSVTEKAKSVRKNYVRKLRGIFKVELSIHFLNEQF